MYRRRREGEEHGGRGRERGREGEEGKDYGRVRSKIFLRPRLISLILPTGIQKLVRLSVVNGVAY